MLLLHPPLLLLCCCPWQVRQASHQLSPAALPGLAQAREPPAPGGSSGCAAARAPLPGWCTGSTWRSCSRCCRQSSNAGEVLSQLWQALSRRHMMASSSLRGLASGARLTPRLEQSSSSSSRINGSSRNGSSRSGSSRERARAMQLLRPARSKQGGAAGAAAARSDRLLRLLQQQMRVEALCQQQQRRRRGRLRLRLARQRQGPGGARACVKHAASARPRRLTMTVT